MTALVVVPSLLSIRSPPFPPLSAAEVEVNPALPPPLSAAGAEVVPGTVPDDNVCMMPHLLRRSRSRSRIRTRR